MMQVENPVYRYAADEYRPGIARVLSHNIRQLPRPEGVGAMGAILKGTPMAGRPLLFTAFLVAMDVLNYQFWHLDKDGQMVRYSHEGKVGALAMQQAFIDCWSRHVLLEGRDQDAIVAAVNGMREELAEKGVEGLFGPIPRPESRLELLNEVLDASGLLAVATGLVARVEHDDALGWGDAQLLAYRFPKGYADDFLKKAQLTLMFIAAEWRAMNCGRQVKLDVSAAADYQLPKVLNALGLIDHGQTLTSTIDKQRLIPADEQMERAIRAATVLACEELAQHWNVGIEEVDFWLWQQRNVAREAKFHLTETNNY